MPSSNDAVIGSSISGRLDAGISLRRLTTINMPMKVCYLYVQLATSIANYILCFLNVAAMPELRTRSGKEPNVNSVEKTSKHNGSHLYTSSNPIATLKAGLRTVRHHALGWLKQDLIASGE